MRTLPGLVALAALALMVPGPAAAPGGAHDVAIRDFAFEPQNLQVAMGDTVVWTNFDTAPHSIIPYFADWNSDDLQAGQGYAHTFDAPGLTFYRSGVHPGMRGSVLALPLQLSR